jgi:hypothetical protein
VRSMCYHAIHHTIQCGVSHIKLNQDIHAYHVKINFVALIVACLRQSCLGRMAGRDLTSTNRMVGRRRVSSASYSSLYDENSPLILASENSIPKYGIDESALEDEENNSQQDTDSLSSSNHDHNAPKSPRTVILVFIVGMDTV